MNKSAIKTQILDDAAINGPMMVDKKMTSAERKKLMEIINKSKAKKAPASINKQLS